MEKKNMKAIDILNETLSVFTKNPSFTFFTALISLPLFLFTIYFQNLFHTFILQSFQSLPVEHHKPAYGTTIFLSRSYDDEASNSTSSWSHLVPMMINEDTSYGYIWSIPIDMFRNLGDDQFRKILHLSSLYLAPLNLLRLVTLVLIVDLASKLYREQKALTFSDMLGVARFDRERLQASLVTFLYVVVFSTCSLFGFICSVLAYSSIYSSEIVSYGIEFYYYSFIRPFEDDILFQIHYGFNLLMLFALYLCWSSIWNLGLVIAVVEGKSGTKALGSSGYLCLRNVKNGMALMLVFSTWEMLSWAPSFVSYGGGYRAWAVAVAQSGWFCLGNAVKWVGFVVYFDNCIKRLFVKRVDVEEQG